MDNIDKFIENITYIGDVDDYLEIANYIIIDIENESKEKINNKIEECITADALKEMCKWGITSGAKYLLFDIRFGYEKSLFNHEVDTAIYEILYDYIEEELEKHYYDILPIEDVTPEKLLECVNKAVTEMDYETFESIAENLF